MSAVARQLLILCALALLPAIGQGFYLRDKISWRERLASDQTVDVTTAKS